MKNEQSRHLGSTADSETLLELVVQSAPTGIVMADANGQVVLANRKAEELFGYREAEWSDLKVEDLIPESFRDTHRKNRTQFVNAPETRQMGVGRDLFALRKDGSEFAVEIGLSPIETPRGSMVVASIIDITERKEAEQARARLSREAELQAEI